MYGRSDLVSSVPVAETPAAKEHRPVPSPSSGGRRNGTGGCSSAERATHRSEIPSVVPFALLTSGAFLFQPAHGGVTLAAALSGPPRKVLYVNGTSTTSSTLRMKK